MSHGGAVTDRAYVALKREILIGRFKPGMPLPLGALAKEFGMSVSPVRGAAGRLFGERLLEPHADGSFECPILSEQALRDLYNWHAHLMRLVLRDRKPGTEKPSLSQMVDGLDGSNAIAIADMTSALFCRFAEYSDDIEHVEAVRAANDRLHAIRLHETVIPDRVRELKAVAAATASGSHRTARAALWSYHRRRLRRVSGIVQAIAGATSNPSTRPVADELLTKL